ncbi:hypothetical protein D0T84_14755 [Dysgonomonas sp. 521]|nr:hypothetical protein [Dysgonomonas sp. 521]
MTKNIEPGLKNLILAPPILAPLIFNSIQFITEGYRSSVINLRIMELKIRAESPSYFSPRQRLGAEYPNTERAR